MYPQSRLYLQPLLHAAADVPGATDVATDVPPATSGVTPSTSSVTTATSPVAQVTGAVNSEPPRAEEDARYRPKRQHVSSSSSESSSSGCFVISKSAKSRGRPQIRKKQGNAEKKQRAW
ncbi:hypothetical protein GQ600_14692 [Phytophthora cactorum]|nr:hypothetical protein GQ600_14692 [Phytophthora cactorum]